MSTEALKWLYWGIATFGVVGCIALFVAAPTMFSFAFNAVVKLFALVVSYRIGCALIAFVLACVIADYHRAKVDEAIWNSRIAQFKEAERQRDMKIDADAREAVRIELDAEKAATKEATEQRDDFDAHLAPLAPTDTVCRVGPDVDRLRSIAGSRRPSSQTHARVLKVGRHR